MQKATRSIVLILTGLFAGNAALAGDSKEPKVRCVILTFKTHFDIGYTDPAHEVVARYRSTMIDKALQVCDESRSLPPRQQFVWTIPGWPMSQILWSGQTPERRQRVLDAFREGRFVVHALPFTTHTETLELEDLVRGMEFSSHLARAVDAPLPRDAKMTDVPSHSWILPTLLKHAGVDFLHLGCNPASASPDVPMLFWWEGPDGSRVLTMYMAGGYGSSLKPPANWPYATWLALIHTGDNQGPPRPGEVRKLLEETRVLHPGVDVRIGRLSDFADAILAEEREVPVVRGDMPDTWIHGPMSDPLGAKVARTTRPALVAAEILNTQLRLWGVPVADSSEEVAAAYEQSLLYGEHTWGGALWWLKKGLSFGSQWKAAQASGEHSRLEASWEEHTDYIRKARRLIQPVLDENIGALARSVNVPGLRLVVYNPLPWSRDGLVTLQCGDARFEALQAVGGGPVIPVEADGRTIRFLARDLPASGYQTYVPGTRASVISTNEPETVLRTIENDLFEVKFDLEKGSVASWIAKRSGRQLVDTSAPHAFGQILYERFDRKNVDRFLDAYLTNRFEWAINELGKSNLPSADQSSYRAASAGGFKLAVHRSPVGVSATMTSPGGQAIPFGVRTRVSLYDGCPFVDLECSLDGKPADPWPEAGWICLPFRIDEPRFRLGRLGSIVDPVKHFVAGSNHHLLWLHTGLAVLDAKGAGIGLCPIDSPSVSLEKPGLWSYSKRFVPKKSRVYVNLFNNQWTTNFRFWNSGSWSSRVRLWVIDHDDPARDFVTPAWEARQPPMGVVFQGPAGTLPPRREGLHLSAPGTLATALTAGEHGGEGALLRLWEQAGKEGPCIIRLPTGLRAAVARPVNLRGRAAGAPIRVKDGRLRVGLRPYSPLSLILSQQDVVPEEN